MTSFCTKSNQGPSGLGRFVWAHGEPVSFPGFCRRFPQIRFSSGMPSQASASGQLRSLCSAEPYHDGRLQRMRSVVLSSRDPSMKLEAKNATRFASQTLPIP